MNRASKESGKSLSRGLKKSLKLDQADRNSQEDLSSQSELSGSTNRLSKTKESSGILGRMFRRSPKPAEAGSQADLSAGSEQSGSMDDLSIKPTKERSTFFGDMFMKKGATIQSQSAVAEVASKLNPFHSANQVKSNPDREKSETPPVPPGPTEEEMKRTSTHNKVKPTKAEDKTIGNTVTPKETAEQLDPDQQGRRATNEAPLVTPRPTEEEIRGVSPNQVQPRKTKDKESNPREKKEKPSEGPAEVVGASVESQSDASKEEESVQSQSNENHPESKKTEDEDKDSSSKEDRREEDDKDKTKTKVQKPKKNNPFMPRVKAKVKQRTAEDRTAGNAAENKGANRSLFDRLEDFRVDPRPLENNEDVENLMDWWNTVESWEDTPQDDDMTEKEEAKAFAVTADKVQKGIRVFNKLFSERGESLWQHIMDLNALADGLDKFNKNTKIAQITGGSTSAIGGVATIAGLALAPVTMGTSLIVTAVGLGVATAGGLTSAGAGISNQVNNSMDRKKVEKIVEDYQEKIADFNKCLKFIKQGIDNLRKFNLLKMKNHAYNQDFPALSSSFYEDGAMAGKAILINANEIMRVVQIANVAGSTAARAVQVASMATGVLTGLFVGMDIYFVAKDSKMLKKGAKSEFAAKIREVAEQLHDGLVELNTIRFELQSTQPESNTGDDGADVDNKKTKGGNKYSSSDEDEIDQIKKQIKKDNENREYV